jgi:hypothetical protein
MFRLWRQFRRSRHLGVGLLHRHDGVTHGRSAACAARSVPEDVQAKLLGGNAPLLRH